MKQNKWNNYCWKVFYFSYILSWAKIHHLLCPLHWHSQSATRVNYMTTLFFIWTQKLLANALFAESTSGIFIVVITTFSCQNKELLLNQYSFFVRTCSMLKTAINISAETTQDDFHFKFSGIFYSEITSNLNKHTMHVWTTSEKSPIRLWFITASIALV